MKTLLPPPTDFTKKKARILDQLSVPEADYADASPKGSVDVGIRHLIDDINRRDGLVTTSSCAGRVSVYLDGGGSATTTTTATGLTGASVLPVGDTAEPVLADGQGRRASAGNVVEERVVKTAGAGIGGKGGGEWLFVSHDPVDGGGEDRDWLAYLGIVTAASEGIDRQVVDQTGGSRLIRFKFEPMILHILTASHGHAQLVVQAGLQAGFRESGAINLTGTPSLQDATPMVAIRSMGLAFESLIGVESEGVRRCLVTPTYLRTLVQVANERFVENSRRIARFEQALRMAFQDEEAASMWEDAEVRRTRKREEGLMRREQLKKTREHGLDHMDQEQIPIDELF